ncbi:hypothetical protein LTR84_012805 [Exophiala bonariae]|uniref:ATP-dependent DNA ligase family profile domain-containing protein n=1 Tax=Exophiala bonariae TaxID=1690606 RepID=A0AAV9MSZ0_9EURO|nr:hypothetical protein LTR84_012805 [Exophiala bonariae]
MALNFLHICDLFEQLSRSQKSDDRDRVIDSWCQQHNPAIVRHGVGALGLLSCLFPEKRPDRVYGLREVKLEGIIVKAAGLGHTRISEIRRLQESQRMDFASAVERVFAATDDVQEHTHSLSVMDVDQTLDRLAATCPFSAPRLRAMMGEVDQDPIDELLSIFRRLHSMETKWLIRLILKDLRPAEIPPVVILQQFHFLMPDLFRTRTNLIDALELLDCDIIRRMPLWPTPEVAKQLREEVLLLMQPRAGTMIALQPFQKARSLKHCRQLAGNKEISVERKYDGEYCQIHVEMTGGNSRITIFSKSGRDSTMDRKGLHDTIRKCLAIGTTGCKFKRQCVLTGELLVWNDRTRRIMPFYKIRRYVSREGRQLGCDRDSPPCEDEHLMIMFYDLLILDDNMCVHEPHNVRRRRLWGTVHRILGRADIGHRVKIDMRLVDGATRLGDEMTSAISRGWEGLVVKACEAPYLSIHGDVQQIKLKKDYIPGFGDSADLVVVGGRYDTKEIWAQSEKCIGWTTFYLACLSNKEAVLHSEAKPIFQLVASVTRPCLSMADVRYLNRYGASHQVPFTKSISQMEVKIESGSPSRPTALFLEPAVVEVVGAGFDRPANQRFLTLRFPRIVKIHRDRTFKDTLDFTDYQRLAQESMALMAEEDVGGQQQTSLASSPLRRVESVPSTSTPSTGSGTETEGHGEHRISEDENLDAESPSVLSGRRQVAKRHRSPEDFPHLPATCKKAKEVSTFKSEKVRYEGKTSPVAVQRTTSQLLNDDVGATCNPPPALFSYDRPSDVRAMVSQEQKSSIHMAFRLSLRNIVTPILLDESLTGLWSEADQELLKLCAKCPLPLTYNKDILLNHLNGQQMIADRSDDHMMATCVVLVHWPSVEMVLAGINPWLRRLEHKEHVFIPRAYWNIIFVEWKALGSLKEDLVESSPTLMDFVQGYVECKDGSLGFSGRRPGVPG